VVTIGPNKTCFFQTLISVVMILIDELNYEVFTGMSINVFFSFF